MGGSLQKLWPTVDHSLSPQTFRRRNANANHVTPIFELCASTPEQLHGQSDLRGEKMKEISAKAIKHNEAVADKAAHAAVSEVQ